MVNRLQKQKEREKVGTVKPESRFEREWKGREEDGIDLTDLTSLAGDVIPLFSKTGRTCLITSAPVLFAVAPSQALTVTLDSAPQAMSAALRTVS